MVCHLAYRDGYLFSDWDDLDVEDSDRVVPELNDHKVIIEYCKTNEYFASIKKLEKKVAAWADAFPIDILGEMKKANAYLVSSGRRYRDYGNFIHRWLNRASGPAIMRPPSMIELMKRVSAKLDIKKGLKKKVDLKARRKLLMEQSELLRRREADGKS